MEKLIPHHERIIQADIERARADQKTKAAKASTPTAISKTDIDALTANFDAVLTDQVDVK